MASSSNRSTMNAGKHPAGVHECRECHARKKHKLDDGIENEELMQLVMTRLKDDQFLQFLAENLAPLYENLINNDQLLKLLMSRVMTDDRFLNLAVTKMEPLFTKGSHFWQKQEELMRRVIQEQAHIFQTINNTPQTPRLPIDQGQNTRYQLQFKAGLPDTIFTSSKFKIEIHMFDTHSKHLASNDHMSSVKVEVLVLDGSVSLDGKENLSQEDVFWKYIKNPRQGKGPLLVGSLDSKQNLVIKLTNGVGSAEVQFSDNSNWTDTRMFKLAARLYENGHMIERVEEGLSTPIRVKERRGEANEKRHLPLLNDEVYHLKGVRKDGQYHERLKKKNIRTVQEFLQALSIDSKDLQLTLCNGNPRGLPKRTWEEIVKHAKKCDPGSETYTFIIGENTLIFNSVFELLGVKHDGNYTPISALDVTQQALVEFWKTLAFSKRENIKLDNSLAEIFSETSSMPQLQYFIQVDEPHQHGQREELINTNQPQHLLPADVPEPHNSRYHFDSLDWPDLEDLDDIRSFLLSDSEQPVDQERSKREAVIRWIKLRVGLKFFASLMTVRFSKEDRRNRS